MFQHICILEGVPYALEKMYVLSLSRVLYRIQVWLAYSSGKALFPFADFSANCFTHY
jgi:hypothetical protein